MMRQLMQTARMLEAEWRPGLEGRTSTGAKEHKSSTRHVWAAGFHHVIACSHLVRILKVMNCLLF
jgi:hypothetical protein